MEETTKKKADANPLADFLAMQSELPVIPKSRDGYNFKYAPYEKVAELAFPVMWKHGFTIIHQSVTAGDSSEVLTTLTHVKSGQSWSSSYAYDRTAKDQERGKSLTYGKRYNTVLLLGLSIEGEPDRDDDVPKAAKSSGGSDF